MAFRKHEVSRALSRGSKSRGQSRKGRCELCKVLCPEALTAVGEAWLNGATVRQIAAREGVAAGVVRWEQLGLDKDRAEALVERHVQVCLYNQHRSRYQRLGTQFDMLWEAINVAHAQYLAQPNMYNGTAYQALCKQLRQTLVDLENVQNASELADDLVRLCLNPMIKGVTNSLISELGSLREDLGAKFSEGEAERMVNDLATRLGAHFKQQSERAHDRIIDLMEARDRNRSKAATGKGSHKLKGGKPKGKHANLKAVS